MSCPHGNHYDGCDICDEVDAAYNSGVEHTKKALAAQPAPAAHRDGHWCVDLTCKKCYSADFRLKHSATPPAAQPAGQEQALGFDVVLDESLPPNTMKFVQPAPVQPAASLKEVDVLMMAETHGIDPSTKGLYGFYIDCISNQPAAQPAIPDAITDNSESPEYRTGWNDCRQAMMEMMK
jgi:hypothetical protein